MRYDMQKFLELCGYDSGALRPSLPKYFIKFDNKMEFDVFISQFQAVYPNAGTNVPNNVNRNVYVYDYGGDTLLYAYGEHIKNTMSAKSFMTLGVNMDDLLEILEVQDEI